MSVFNKKDTKIKIRACRICLDTNSVDMVLIEEQNGWLKLFEYCFGITLTIQDEPRLLCQICAEKVQNYVKFKEKMEKSHSLWKSVSSNVKCSVVKHLPKVNENTKINTNDEIKEETLDPLLDSDIIFSDNYGIEIVDLSHPEIKKETHVDVTKSRNEESSKNQMNGCVFGVNVNLNQNEYKTIDSNGSVKNKEAKVYTCVNCKLYYEKKGWYLKHIKECQKRKVSKKRIFNQEYAYDLGRQYNGQSIAKVKHESESEIKMIGNQNQCNSLYSCGLCNLNFATNKDVCLHLNDHWSNNELACKLCDFVGIDLAATVAHRYSHFPRKIIPRFLCHICVKFHISLFALHFHYRKEHLKKPGGYCSRCNKEYNKLRQWKKHELTHCPPKHVCDMCGKGFHFKHAIREHMINHMQLNMSICDVCGKTFARLRNMKQHKKKVHTKSEPFKCTHCNRMFKNEFTLRIHQTTVNREKTLKCEVCQRCFITPNVLKLHMVMHSNERPYGCDICGISYKYKSQLTFHLLKHNGVSHQCLICMKTFSNSRSLKRHSSVHTGVRQYSCVVSNCVRTFHSKKLMLEHLELRHKNENGGEKIEIASANSVNNNQLVSL